MSLTIDRQGQNSVTTTPISNQTKLTDATTLGRTSDQIVSEATKNSSRFLSDYKIDASNTSTANTDIFTNVNQFVSSLPSTAEGVVNTGDGRDVNRSLVNDYLPYLETNYLPLLRFVRQSLAESKRPDYTLLQEQKATTDESKSRVETIKAPEKRVSYFEGWFPLVRPISEPGLFALFGIGLLFLFVAIALFLRLGGVQFQLILPTFFASDTMPIDYTRFIYVGGIAGVIVGVSLWGYYTKGWFGGKQE